VRLQGQYKVCRGGEQDQSATASLSYGSVRTVDDQLTCLAVVCTQRIVSRVEGGCSVACRMCSHDVIGNGPGSRSDVPTDVLIDVHLQDLDADLLVEVLCPVQDLGQALAGVQQRNAAACGSGRNMIGPASISRHHRWILEHIQHTTGCPHQGAPNVLGQLALVSGAAMCPFPREGFWNVMCVRRVHSNSFPQELDCRLHDQHHAVQRRLRLQLIRS